MATSGQVPMNSSTATSIVAAISASTVDASSEGPQYNERSVYVKNTSAQVVYVGGTSAVTAGTGYPLAQNEVLSLSLGGLDALYGLSASSTPTIAYIVSG